MSLRTLPKFDGLTTGAQAALKLSSQLSARADKEWRRDIRSAANGENNVITIMDVIGQDFFGGGITANRVAGALRNIGNKPVTVEINSPGGDFFEGMAIYNVLREHPKAVTVKILGMAASAAATVAMAGDTIQIARAGFLMIHNTLVLLYGNKTDLRAAADFLEPFDRTSVDVYAARSGQDAKDVAKMMDEETWFGGADAIEAGFADEFLPSDAVKTSPKNEGAAGVTAALKRLDELLARGEKVPRSERRNLFKEITGTPRAAEDGTPRAAETGEDWKQSLATLRLGLGALTLAKGKLK